MPEQILHERNHHDNSHINLEQLDILPAVIKDIKKNYQGDNLKKLLNGLLHKHYKSELVQQTQKNARIYRIQCGGEYRAALVHQGNRFIVVKIILKKEDGLQYEKLFDITVDDNDLASVTPLREAIMKLQTETSVSAKPDAKEAIGAGDQHPIDVPIVPDPIDVIADSSLITDNSQIAEPHQEGVLPVRLPKHFESLITSIREAFLQMTMDEESRDEVVIDSSDQLAKVHQLVADQQPILTELQSVISQLTGEAESLQLKLDVTHSQAQDSAQTIEQILSSRLERQGIVEARFKGIDVSVARLDMESAQLKQNLLDQLNQHVDTLRGELSTESQARQEVDGALRATAESLSQQHTRQLELDRWQTELQEWQTQLQSWQATTDDRLQSTQSLLAGHGAAFEAFRSEELPGLMSALKQQLVQTQRTLEGEASQRGKLSAQLDALSQEIQRDREQLASMQTATQTLVDQQTQLVHQHEDLSSRVDSLRDDQKLQLDTVRSECQAAVAHLNSEIQKMSKTVSQFDQQLRASFQQLTKRAQSQLDQSVSTLQASVSGTAAEIPPLVDRVNVSESEIVALKEQLAVLLAREEERQQKKGLFGFFQKQPKPQS